MNDSVQVEYNSEYELIEKPPHDDRKAKSVGIRVKLLLGLIAFFVVVTNIVAMTVQQNQDAIKIHYGFLVAQILNFSIIILMFVALWRVRLVEDWSSRILWILIIFTGIGALAFLLLDPTNDGKKKKLAMG